MKTVYICSPFKGEMESIKRYTRFAIKCGAAPVVPHFLHSCMDKNDPQDKVKANESCLSLMTICDELWILGNKRTDEMKKEIDFASRKLRIPIISVSDWYVDEVLEKNGGD